MESSGQKPAAALDLVWGAEEIGRVIGRNPRQVYNMLEKGLLPAKQVSNRWVAERGTLVRFFQGDAP